MFIFFSNLRLFDGLDLSGCDIKEIDDFAFANASIRGSGGLNLFGNPIRQIGRSAFEGIKTHPRRYSAYTNSNAHSQSGGAVQRLVRHRSGPKRIRSAVRDARSTHSRGKSCHEYDCG